MLNIEISIVNTSLKFEFIMTKGCGMSKKKRMQEVLRRLKSEFPNSKCALNFSNVFELLVATILSAQCTDERVNMVTADLFKKYKSPKGFAEADLEELQEDVRSTGFYRNKGKNIKSMAQRLVDDFDGEVPDNVDDLVSLAGVARKTANVVLGVGFGEPAGVVVDTHVGRLSRRLGFTKETNAVKVEKDLVKLVPKEDWVAMPLLFIDHGRKTCKSRKPRCKDCELVDICPGSKEFLD